MQQREWDLARIECLFRQAHHNGRILADGIQHDRIVKFRCHFAEDEDAFRFKCPEVRQN
jgi:hypothetical protein